jgi:hypothetical protein
MNYIRLLCLLFLATTVTASVGHAYDEVVAAPLSASQTLTVTVNVGKNGSVSPRRTIKVKKGGQVTYKVTPKKNYLIDTLTVNGAPAKSLPKKKGQAYTLKITKIVENKTVTVSFALTRTVSSLAVGSQISVVDAK